MKHITAVRKAVCTIANQLHGEGYSLSVAFKMAWHRVRETKFRAAGVTMDGRQNRLAYLKGFSPDDLQIGFRREPQNQYDSNAIQILVQIKSLRKYAVIGYVPRTVSAHMAAVMDKGIKVGAELLGIIGGYSYKENYGLLVGMAV